MNIKEIVLDVIRHALNDEIYKKPIEQEKPFYQMIIENGLSGLVYSSLSQDFMSKELYFRIEKSFFEYVNRDLKQLEAMKLIRFILNEEKIDFMFLKGSRLKSMYKESYMRAMGDMDILIREHDLKRVHEVFLKHEIICTQTSKQHDVFEMKNKLVIEIHPTLYKNFNPKYESLLKDSWKYAEKIENHEYQFSPEFELVYLLYHLAKHMDSSGIGLRSVLDIGIFIQNQESILDEEKLREYLMQSDLFVFHQSMVEINHKCFGLTFQKGIHQVDRFSDMDLDMITDYIVKSGIHGLGNAHNPFASRIASYELKKKSKFRLIIDLIFPDYESVKGMYPFTRKWKPLIVIGWIMRWFRLIFKKRKSSLNKIKQLNAHPKDIDQQIEIFEKIGI